MKRVKSRTMAALLTILTQLPVIFLTAYLTAHYMVTKEGKEQKKQEQKYVENLKEAVRNEAGQNARSIRRWVPKLTHVAKSLQDFVNDKGHVPPGVDPGHGSLTVVALQVPIESPVAARHMLPCLHTTLAAIHYRLREGNMVKREVDAALVEYTATFPGPLPEAYIAAARLHARIEQLLEIYKKMPDGLGMLVEVINAQNCGEDEGVESRNSQRNRP